MMKYRWKALFEHSSRIETKDGSETIYKQIEKQGQVEDAHSGQEIIPAILESTKFVGNLIHFEVERYE